MRLLVVGPLDTQVSAAVSIAKKRGAQVTHSPDIGSAIQLICSGKGADLIMVDANLNIRELMAAMENERIHSEVVAYGINEDSKKAVDAIKAGAKEFVPLPPEEDLIAAILESVTKESDTLIYSSPAMQQVIQLTDQVSKSDASILITGESGTGKEVIARYIHKKSRRTNGPFISVNCAAIPENLLESEMFGHEKGAFTGAANRRIGKFEEANGGTLLLDEISEMDIRLQAKLLRVIQERVVDRVGGTQPVKLDVRILATSNRHLQEEVKKGTFREDLFFRLNVINLHLPPLRERREDIPLLVKYFVQKYSEANHIAVKPLTEGALKKLQEYHWPGNVRELENTMHRAVLLSSGSSIETSTIFLTDDSTKHVVLASEASHTTEQPQTGTLVGRSLEDVEKELIMNTLDHCLGNRTHAAEILGISIRTLRNKLNQYKDDVQKASSS